MTALERAAAAWGYAGRIGPGDEYTEALGPALPPEPPPSGTRFDSTPAERLAMLFALRKHVTGRGW